MASSFLSAALSEAQKQKISETVKELGVVRSKSVVEYVGSLRTELTSKDASIREMAINELSAVILQLPEDVVSPEIANFLLEFLLPRVEDSGHVAAEFLIAVVHFLVLRCGKNLSREVLAQAIGTLYETNGVQSYAQRDRMRLFELLHYLLDNFLEEVQTIFDPSKFVVAFMRAANSERDPRCLLKIFKLYNVIVHNFSLGDLTEDMFELIACYYPIDYEPNEMDLGKISSEMLSIGCESCLLAHESFAPFCFQLIAEKLLDDIDVPAGDGAEIRLKQQLSICNFLCKACETFGQSISATSGLDSASRAELDNFLTAFRLIALNPTQTRQTLVETRRCLSSTCAALAANFLRTRKDASKDLQFMAENTLEHCELFVLQAEMGLTGKALIVLEAVAKASQLSAEIVVPKVLYWFNVLLTGMTLKSAENRQEICEEAMEFLPHWFEMAQSMVFSDNVPDEESLLKVLADVFDAMDGTEEFCSHQKVLCAKFESACRGKLFALFSRDGEGKNLRRCCQIVDRLAGIVFEIDVDGKPSQASSVTALMAAVRRFVGEFSADNYEKCRSLLAPSICKFSESLLSISSESTEDKRIGDKERKMVEPTAETSKCFQPAMFYILGAVIQTKESAEWISPVLFGMASATVNDKIALSSEFCESILDTFRRLSAALAKNENEPNGTTNDDTAFSVFWTSFEKFVAKILSTAYLRSEEAEESELFQNLLQDVGSLLDESQHNAFVEFLLAKFDEQNPFKNCTNYLRIISLPFFQSKSLDYVEQFADLVITCLSLSRKQNNLVGISSDGTESALKQILLHIFFAVFVNRSRMRRANSDKEDASEIANLLAEIYRQLCTCHCANAKSGVRENVTPTLATEILASDEFVGSGDEIGKCECEWRFRAKIARTRALLLTDSRHGVLALTKLFEFLLQNSSGVNANLMSEELLNFWNRAIDPIRCDLTCTLMWKQRIFCQFVPIYVDYFGKISAENMALKVAFLRLIESLFRLAKAVGQPTSRELRMIMPILTQTFSMISTNSSTENGGGMNLDLVLLLDSTLELLKATATIDELNRSGAETEENRPKGTVDDTPLTVFLRVFANILHNESEQKMEVVLKCLECLEVLAQKAAAAQAHEPQMPAKTDPTPLKAFHARIVQGTISLTKSRKRLIRQRAATVRNLWELL